MKEIIKGITFQEYYLTIIRISVFLDYLGSDHKKSTTEDRLVLYDFYLKFPELTNDNTQNLDFDTKYSYFHWKPNYKLYSAILADLYGRKLVSYSKENKRYYISELGTEFVANMKNPYTETSYTLSEYISKNICQLSNKAIIADIDKILLKKRGSIN